MRRIDFANEDIYAIGKSGLHNINSLQFFYPRPRRMWYEMPMWVSRRGDWRGREWEIFNLLQWICIKTRFISEYFVTCRNMTHTYIHTRIHAYTHAHTMVPLWNGSLFASFLFYDDVRSDTSLARNEAGGIRFSSVRTARAENDVQNYFRGNDPFPTDNFPFPSSLPSPSILMEIITACSLFAPFKG